MRAHDVPKVLWLALPAALVIAAAGCGDGDSLSQQQAEVAERGAQVMPFDLDATTHTFTKAEDGGVQTVAADDPTDATQIELIRQHLQEEQDNFARGDFSDPAAIHGHNMDGVAELRAGYRDITVDYLDRPDGAQLAYHTDRADLVEALHAWFDRQVMDHGPDAEAG